MSFEVPDTRSDDEKEAERQWEQGSSRAVQELFRWGKLDEEAQLRWIDRLMQEDRIDVIDHVITGASPRTSGIIPGSVAAALIEAGKVICVERKIDAFREGDIPESVALALIARGRSGVSAVLGYRNRFSGFSQHTFDALHAESPQLLDAIRMNLRLFHGLTQDAAGRLRAAGYAKEVDANPEAFE